MIISITYFDLMKKHYGRTIIDHFLLIIHDMLLKKYIAIGGLALALYICSWQEDHVITQVRYFYCTCIIMPQEIIFFVYFWKKNTNINIDRMWLVLVFLLCYQYL